MMTLLFLGTSLFFAGAVCAVLGMVIYLPIAMIRGSYDVGEYMGILLILTVIFISGMVKFIS